MRRLLVCLAVAAASCVPAGAAAQTGSGTTGAAVLQLPAGARAAALGGAYAAAADADALFYNPASAAWFSAVAGASYQRHADDIGFATAAASFRVGPAAVGVALAHLDYGSISEVRPDPAFGGQRGAETGRSVGASEVAGRVLIAAPLPGQRVTVGAAAGLVWVGLAETGRLAPVIDAGVQFRAGSGLALGAALRNAGGPLDGARLTAAPLPTELRGGATWDVPFEGPADVRLSVSADAIFPTDASTTAALGAELLLPTGPRAITGSLRAGYNGTAGAAGVGRISFGGGLARDRFALDYAFQDMSALGAVHRFGVRWTR
jgi:hypothetical protein